MSATIGLIRGVRLPLNLASLITRRNVSLPRYAQQLCAQPEKLLTTPRTVLSFVQHTRQFCARSETEEPEDPSAEYKLKAKALETALAEETARLNDKVKDIQDKYMRSLAETENVRTRMKKQVDDAKLFGIQGFCKDLLDVADILGKATESVPSEKLTAENPQLVDLFDGLTMTHTQLQKVFSRHGLMPINPAEGERFDPNCHEAMFELPVPGKEAGTIAVVSKVGYKLHERTVRPTLVGVFKAV